MTGPMFPKPAKKYAAIFLVAASTLAFEITLSRIFSVIVYYYLAYTAISIAMLGMTAGAVTVFIKRKHFLGNRLEESLSLYSLLLAASFLLTVLSFQFIPVVTYGFFLRLGSLLILIFFSALPFYFSGIIIAAALTEIPLPVNRLYTSDLAGAAAGCLLVLAGLEWVDAPSLVIFFGLPALASSYLFGRHYKGISLTIPLALLFVIIAVIGSFNQFFGNIIRPLTVKGKIENRHQYVFEKWNSFSRITVDQPVFQPPQYWGPSPRAPRDKNIIQYKMTIDGDAGTVLRKYSIPEDLRHLEFDLVNFAYFLKPNSSTCIIGAGAGKDIQAAIHFGQKKITAIDINPILTGLLKGKFREIANVADNPALNLITDDARSYLSRDTSMYDLVQMSLVDTWAATGAGAFSLSENNLYTIEAWETFIRRLHPDGLLTVSRWYNPSNLGETGRLVSLAVETLFKSGKSIPSDHIVLLTTNNLSTIIVSNSPFDRKTVGVIREKASSLQFNTIALPGMKPANRIIEKILHSNSAKELRASIKNEELNLSAPTDENPYFFNMLKLENLDLRNLKSKGGIMSGNLQASVSLLLLIGGLIIFSIVTILLPLAVNKLKVRSTVVPMPLHGGVLYFALIGAGFILAEMGMLQRLSVFLGQPVYALGIVLTGIILSAGLGSFLNGYVNTGPRMLSFLAVIASLIVMLSDHLLQYFTSMYITVQMPQKILLSLAVIFPAGILLGQFFPSGIRMIKNIDQENLSWYWAINGIFSVLFSAIAIFISVYAGISYNFIFSAVCYAALSAGIWLIHNKIRFRTPG